MSIPFLILRRIQISRQQELVLSVIFSLVILTIIFAVVRATITTIGVRRQIDPMWMYMWTSIELNIVNTHEDIFNRMLSSRSATIVACVAPYRTLFIRRRDSKQQAPRPHASLKDPAFKLFSSSGRSVRTEDTSCAYDDMPYLAPWPNLQALDVMPTKHDSHKRMPKTPAVTYHCNQPWMTVNLPHLKPWRDESSQALPQAQLRDYRSMP